MTLPAACWICVGEAEVGLRERRVERRLHERLLERVAVVEDFQLRRLGVGGDARGDVGWDHDGGEHFARVDLRHRLGARGHFDRLDLVEQLARVLADATRWSPTLTVSPGGV